MKLIKIGGIWAGNEGPEDPIATVLEVDENDVTFRWSCDKRIRMLPRIMFLRQYYLLRLK